MGVAGSRDALDQDREVGISEQRGDPNRDHQPDDAGAPCGQASGNLIGVEIVLPRNGQYTLPGSGAHIGLVIEDARHGGA